MLHARPGWRRYPRREVIRFVRNAGPEGTALRADSDRHGPFSPRRARIGTITSPPRVLCGHRYDLCLLLAHQWILESARSALLVGYKTSLQAVAKRFLLPCGPASPLVSGLFLGSPMLPSCPTLPRRGNIERSGGENIQDL